MFYTDAVLIDSVVCRQLVNVTVVGRDLRELIAGDLLRIRIEY